MPRQRPSDGQQIAEMNVVSRPDHRRSRTHHELHTSIVAVIGSRALLETRHINDEPVFHIAFQHSLIGRIDVIHGDHLDV